MAQKIMMFALMLLLASITANAQGWMSRYWDGCKPSCSWSGNSGGNPCKECNKQNQLMSTSDQNRSACDGGTAYTCWDMAPWQVDANTAYGFVATNPPNSCGSCLELTFTGEGQHGTGPSHRAIQGKKLIVMASNIGGDVGSNQLDLLVPGGGVGAFNAFSSQINVSNGDLGAQYGGLLSACPDNNNASVAANQSCLKSKCSQVFGKSGLEWLKAGCDFYADWLMAANNPKFTSRSVSCPSELTSRYKNAGGNPQGGSSSSVTPPTTYTLTVNRNPTGGGTTNPAASQANITAGTPVTITATAANGYTFQNWTAGTGSPNFANAYSANTTVTLYANATITANFTQQPVQPTTYTLTVNRQPANGGSTNPAASQENITAGTPVNISATANSGYTFQGWVLVTGTATFANANSATTTVTLTSNATIRANFTQNSSSSVSVSSSSSIGISSSSNVSVSSSSIIGVSSSSIGRSSSSIPGSPGDCIQPPGQGNPPNGIETCIVVNGKCYICNPARGQECSNSWLWDGLQVDSDWWFSQVSCSQNVVVISSSSRPASSSSSSRLASSSSSISNPVNSSSSRLASSSSSSGGIVPVLSQIAYSNGAHIQANGIYLQVMNNAKLELFDLRGNSVKKMNFSNGAYSVQLNDLPKGLYLAKISFGSERKILRVPLR